MSVEENRARLETTYESEGHRVASHWADDSFTSALARAHWMASPVVRSYLNRLATRNPGITWLRYLIDRYARRRKHRILVLGCGEGWLERSIAAHPLVERIDACDIAAGAVERAKAEAARLGLDRIHYHVADLNRDPIPPGPYELIIAHSIVHHIENLELLYDGLHRALVDDGLLILAEYVGPRRFQFTDQQLRVIDRLLRALPACYRKGVVQPIVYEAKPRPTVEEMIRNDPSEAVRSDDIDALTKARFAVLETLPGGGTILMHLLFDIVQNFEEDSDADRAILSILCLLEEVLITRGVIESDHVYLAASKSRLEPAPAHERRANPYATDDAMPLRGLLRRLRSISRTTTFLHPPGAHIRAIRESENEHLTGRRDVDWITDAIDRKLSDATSAEGLRVLALGKGAELLAKRLRATAGIAVARSFETIPKEPIDGEYDIAFELGVLSSSDAASVEVGHIADALAPGATLVGLERTSAELPRWADRFAGEVARALPTSRGPFTERARGLWSAVPREKETARSLTAAVETRFDSVRVDSLTSPFLQRILGTALFDPETSRDADVAIQQIVVAVDRILLDEAVIEPSWVRIQGVRR